MEKSIIKLSLFDDNGVKHKAFVNMNNVLHFRRAPSVWLNTDTKREVTEIVFLNGSIVFADEFPDEIYEMCQ